MLPVELDDDALMSLLRDRLKISEKDIKEIFHYMNNGYNVRILGNEVYIFEHDRLMH